MIARGLKSNILINIVVLLFIGMLLINIVTVLTFHRDLLRAEVDRVDLFLDLFAGRAGGAIPLNTNAGALDELGSLVRDSELTCAAALDRAGKTDFSTGSDCEMEAELRSCAADALRSGNQEICLAGQTWGIFWLQDRYLMVAKPFVRPDRGAGAVGAVSNLESLYQRERRSQKIFFVYIFINIAILTIIGVYRISKIYLEPLYRLARRAEDYREEDEGMIFAVRKEDNELHQLSKSLNRMLARIADDKKKLRQTVSSLERANLDLKKAQREIIRAEKLASVGRLSAGIAHEIGNPIGIVMGYLDLLKQNESDIDEGEKREYIRRTEDEISRINTIIRQLLDLSRPAAEGVAPIHVHEIVADMTDVIRFQPLMSKIDFQLCLDAENDRVIADGNQLRQVFLNLALNAVDAMAVKDNANGRLIIRTSVVGSNEGAQADDAEKLRKLRIEVIDNGPGIAPENLGVIFDPFFTTKEPGKGTGLGLSVSFMIVESIGGQLTAASEEGKGTTMIVELPLCPSAPMN